MIAGFHNSMLERGGLCAWRESLVNARRVYGSSGL